MSSYHHVSFSYIIPSSPPCSLAHSKQFACTCLLQESGKELYTLQHKSGVRVVQFAEGEQMLMTVQDNTFSSQPTIFIYNLNADQSGLESKVPVRAMHRSDRVKINGALWGALNQTIIAAYDDGSIALWDVEKGVETVRVHEHKKGINDLQYNKDRTMIITASSDQTCHVYDATTLKLLKSFRSDRPLNAAAFSPLFNQIILGGGQEAMNVTNSSSKAGHFEVDFYHIIFEEYMSSVKGHFGPVNTLAMGVDGKSFASGAEDGYIRLHHFDKQYFASSTKYNW